MIPPRIKNRTRRGGGSVVVVASDTTYESHRNNTNYNNRGGLSVTIDKQQTVSRWKSERKWKSRQKGFTQHTTSSIQDQKIIVTQSSSSSSPLRLPLLPHNSLPCRSIFFDKANN
mmetsp:Transcript_42518/g.47551  ORF Transcript_42518/g.47551 Transcript_42518/m.47551 type:complete len:115 (+) Transcript_42518:3-347(+)